MALIDPRPAPSVDSEGGKHNIYEVLDATTYEALEDQEIITANDFFLTGDLDLKGDLSLVITNDVNNKRSVNIYAVDRSDTYQIERNQQLVSAKDFQLEGDIDVAGDWVFVTTYNADERASFTATVFGSKFNQEISWQYNPITDDYFMTITHGLSRHPFVKMLAQDGTELEPKIVHITKNRLKIISNIQIQSELHVI